MAPHVGPADPLDDRRAVDPPRRIGAASHHPGDLRGGHGHAVRGAALHPEPRSVDGLVHLVGRELLHALRDHRRPGEPDARDARSDDLRRLDVHAAPDLAATAAVRAPRLRVRDPCAALAHGRRAARRPARAHRGGRERRACMRRAVRRDGDDGRHLSHGMGNRRRLRAGGARAGRTARGALQRERGSHARSRGHRRAARARSEEPPGRDQGPLDAHGA